MQLLIASGSFSPVRLAKINNYTDKFVIFRPEGNHIYPVYKFLKKRVILSR